jgi:DNA repair protein SbcD/Mre11
MRFLHTADWHLGRKFGRISLQDDQANLVDQIERLAIAQSVEAVVIAGDLFDKPKPPGEAVLLFRKFLQAMQGAHIPVLAIAGNHDSADFIGFLEGFTEGAGLYMAGGYDAARKPIALRDAHGPVYFALVPFLESGYRPAWLPTEEAATYQQTLREICLHQLGQVPPGSRVIAVAHPSVKGARFSGTDILDESGNVKERRNEEGESRGAMGTAEWVDASVFEGFCYTALGHFHRGHFVDGERRVRYGSSIFPYSFKEADDVKSVSVVEMDAAGEVQVDEIPLRLPRSVLRVTGTVTNGVLAVSHPKRLVPEKTDFVEIMISEQSERTQLEAIIRDAFPLAEYAFPVASDSLLPQTFDLEAAGEGVLPPEVLFTEFYEWVTGEALELPVEEILAFDSQP